MEKQLFTKKNVGNAYFFMICVYLLISFLLSFFLLYYSGESTFIKALSFLPSSLAIIIVLDSYSKIYKTKLQLGVFKNTNYQSIIMSVTLAFSMILGLGFVNSLISRFFESLGYNASSIDIKMDSFSDYLIYTVMVCVFPAIFEELFFRGFLVKALNCQNKIKTAILIGLLFSVYHCSISQFAYQFIYGFLFTLLFYEFGLFSCMLAHFLNNFIIVSCEYFSIEIDLFNPYYIVIGLCLLLVVVFVLAIKLIRGNKGKTISKEEGKLKLKEVILPYGIVGIAICILLLVINLVSI